MTNDPHMTHEELDALLHDEDAEIDVQEVPATFYTEDDVFVVKDRNAWAYMPTGYFATGRWADTDLEMDVLLPYQRVHWIKFDFSALEDTDAGDSSSA